MLQSGKWSIEDKCGGFTVLDWALFRKDLKKDVFEFLVYQSITIGMKVN
jgi:hypothetical protein